jgi:proline iminopeptidase
LHFRAVGEGPPIVVLHGGPDFDHEYFVPEMDRLAESFRLVYYDQRGRGRSFEGPGPVDVTMESEVDDLDRVRAWFGFDSVAVLGHSWGCLLALEYAIRHSARVSGLILMNGVPASHDDVPALRAELARRRTPAQTDRMAALRADPKFAAGDIETEAEYYHLHYGTTLRDPELLDAVVGRLRTAFTPEGVLVARAIEERLYGDTWACPDYDLLPALSGLDVPTLILHGDDDFVPLDIVRRIADAIPRARLVVLPDCGHFVYLEQPERAATLIAEFLTPPKVVEASRTIAADAAVIFELIADPARQPSWDGNDNLAEAAPGQRVRGVGDVFVMTLTMGAVRHNHVVEFEEGRRIAWRPSEPGGEPPGHLWRWTLQPIGDGTLVTHTYDWTRLTDPARFERARATTSDRLAGSLNRLAALVEAANR